MRRASIILCAAVLASGLQATAQGLGQLKKQMAKRHAQITLLKTAKTVGENNEGFLHILGDMPAASKAVVEAENVDRKLVYAAIAAKNTSAAKTVGVNRAKGLARTSAPGTMVQAPDGNWYEKK